MGPTLTEPLTPTLPLIDGRPMRVGLDGFNLALDKGTGVATYGRNLSHSLKSMGAHVDVLYGAGVRAGDDPLLKEVMFFDGPPPEGNRWLRLARMARSPLGSTRHQAFEIPVTGAVVTDALAQRLPRFDRLLNVSRLFERAHARFELTRGIQRVRIPQPPDVMHWTYPLPIRVEGVPNIYTLHDLVPLRLPYTTLDRKASYLALMKWIARTADHIVTVSEASRRDIIELLNVPPERVTNTYQAVHVPASLLHRDESAVHDEVRGVFQLEPGEYFMFFGSIEPKKNLGRLIEAFLASGVGSQLVVVGARAWKSKSELRLLESLPAGDRRVVQIEYLPFPMLVSLIRAARAVVFPSLYEGFGLPVLEAMLLGTPVLTSDTSSLPEVAADAALKVNPYRVDHIIDGLRRLDGDDMLREDLSRRGRTQAQRFSEAAYAHRLADLYAAVAAAGRR